MRGRRPEPAGIQQAKGNPGRRQVADQQQPDGESADQHLPEGKIAVPKPQRAKFALAKTTADTRKVYDLIGPQLRHMNILRDTDDPAFWRYCQTVARYWRVTEELERLGGETYECATTNGGTMLRLRPQFIVQERLARRLDSFEDRFGLTPMARQQYILALQRQPALPFDPPAARQTQNDPKSTAPAAPQPAKPPAIGGARAVH